MSVNFKAKLLSAITNAAYISKTVANVTLAKLGMADADVGNDSGPAIDNAQKFINQIADTSGETENDANRKIYSSNNFIADGDNKKVAIGKLDGQAQVNADGIQSINDSIGQPDGIAPLDSGGLVPAANLPSYVDDVEEYADLASFPVTGETGKIYVALDTGRIYRWSGSAYFEISQSPVDSVNGKTGTVLLGADNDLDNVTNDAQLKRSGADFSTFTEKVSPVVDDIVLIEDSEDALNKKTVKLQNLLGGGGGGGGLDVYYTQDFESFQITDIVDTGTDPSYGVNSVDITAKLSIETTDPIAGDQSLQYIGTGTDAGDWVAIENITVRDRERAVQSARNIWLDNQSSSEVNLIVYDVTNGAVIKEQIVAANSNLQKYLIEFTVPETCNEIQIGFQVVDDMVASEFLVIDNIELTTDPFVYAEIQNTTDWLDGGEIQFDALFTAPTKGTTSIDAWRVARSGAIGELYGRYYQTTAGTGGSGQYLIKLPVVNGQQLEFPDETNFITGNIVLGNTEEAFASSVGYATFGEAGFARGDGHIIPYDSTQFRVLAYVKYASVNEWGNDYFGIDVSSIGVTLHLTTEIKGWTGSSENVVTPSKSNMFDTKIVEGITIEGTTTDPTKGNVVRDRISYSQKGDLGFFRYEYRHTTAGVAGNGEYLYTLPDNLEFDDTKVEFFTTPFTNTTAAESIVNGWGYSKNNHANNSSGTDGFIIPYDSTRFRLIANNFSSSIQPHDSIYYPYSLTGLEWSCEFTVPIKGWTSETQFLSLIPVQKTAYLKDVKPSGTSGGTFTGGSYQTRVLNTVEGNAELVSLSANQFTLQAGEYEIEATAPAVASGAVSISAHKIKLRDITNSLDAILGQSASAQSQGGTSVSVESISTLYGKIKIDSATTYELQHRCTTGQNTVGFGVASSFGDNETYAQVKITKVK